MKLVILKRHEEKKLKELIKNRFGFEGELDYSFLKSGKNKIWMVNKSIRKLNLRELEVARIGLLFCRTDFKEIQRISVEGSQLIGSECFQGVLRINKKQLEKWMKGKDLNLDREPDIGDGLVLVRNRGDFLGSGSLKGKKVWNHLNRERRIK